MSRSILHNPPVLVALPDDRQIFRRRFGLLSLLPADVGYHLYGVAVLAENYFIRPVVNIGVAFVLVQRSQVSLRYIVDAADNFVVWKGLDGGLAAAPLPRPAGEDELVVGQGG